MRKQRNKRPKTVSKWGGRWRFYVPSQNIFKCSTWSADPVSLQGVHLTKIFSQRFWQNHINDPSEKKISEMYCICTALHKLLSCRDSMITYLLQQLKKQPLADEEMVELTPVVPLQSAPQQHANPRPDDSEQPAADDDEHGWIVPLDQLSNEELEQPADNAQISKL